MEEIRRDHFVEAAEKIRRRQFQAVRVLEAAEEIRRSVFGRQIYAVRFLETTEEIRRSAFGQMVDSYPVVDSDFAQDFGSLLLESAEEVVWEGEPQNLL